MCLGTGVSNVAVLSIIPTTPLLPLHVTRAPTVTLPPFFSPCCVHHRPGAYSQSRSLAYHNNGTLQYYALNFGENDAALHGANILKQAAYLNDALRKIHEVHTAKANAAADSDEKKKKKKKKKGKKAPAKLKVAVVGHSLGGLVARVAVLLENHPRCLVNNLVMLNSPNVAPAYAMDPSLLTLMDATNQVRHVPSCHVHTRHTQVAHL